MANWLTPDLFDLLIWFASGSALTVLVISITRGVPSHRERSQRRDLDPAPWGPWHESPSGAHRARQVARGVMEDWQETHGPMSALQAVAFVVEVLSSPHVRGWTSGLESVRLNVINLARHVAASQQQEPGRNGAGGEL